MASNNSLRTLSDWVTTSEGLASEALYTNRKRVTKFSSVGTTQMLPLLAMLVSITSQMAIHTKSSVHKNWESVVVPWEFFEYWWWP